MTVKLTNDLSLKNWKDYIKPKEITDNGISFKVISLFSGELRIFEEKGKVYIKLDSPIRLIQEREDEKNIRIQISFTSQKFNKEEDFNQHIKYLNNIKKDIKTICDLFEILNIKLKK